MKPFDYLGIDQTKNVFIRFSTILYFYNTFKVYTTNYKPPISFRTVSLDNTHYLAANRMTGIRRYTLWDSVSFAQLY